MQAPPRNRLIAETWIILALSLGRAAVYSVIALIAMLSAGPLRDQTATLNARRAREPWLDLTYQLAAIFFSLIPVLLALYLISIYPGRPLKTLGLTRERLPRSTLEGFALAAVIGVPGLGFYLLARELGITVSVEASALDAFWWTVPVLVLAAIQTALLEEIIAVGYLMTRLKNLSWGVPAMILSSALLRGSYHLYQGIGAALGNVVMGVVFAWFYHRTGRLWPLIVAHAIIDIVAFVGYFALADRISWL